MFLIKLDRNNTMVEYALSSKGIIRRKNHGLEACVSKIVSGLMDGKMIRGTY